MRVLIDIGHPAHVHLFRNFIFEMQKRGHKIIVASKKVHSINSLLELYGIKYIIIGEKHDNLLVKYLDQIRYITKLINISIKNNIDCALGVSMILPIVAKFRKMVVFGFDDDDASATPTFAKYVNKSNVILTPDVLRHECRGNHHITYAGYHELAYLHPNRFHPNPDVLSQVNLGEGEPFFIMRFNAFKAHHDIGVRGLSLEQKLKLIKVLKPHGRIIITTEREIEPELKQYKYNLAPDKIHHLLYYATMFIGDSQTMTSEAAVLGTPAIRCNTFVGKISYLEEEEHRYGLTYGFTPNRFEEMLEKVKELLSISNLKEEWQKRRERMLRDKIDVTSFLVWFVENYPESVRIMRENPDYQYRFK